MIIRRFMWRLFGWRSVLLIDHDGWLTPAYVRKLGRHWFARRHGKQVILKPNGEVGAAPSYVEGWEPLIPLGESDVAES